MAVIDTKFRVTGGETKNRNCSKTAEKNIKTAGKSVNRKAGTT